MRLFVAIELDVAVKKALGRTVCQLATFDGAVRWAAEERMHLTLRFLGEAPADRVGRLCETLEGAAARCEPFALATSRWGCFPPGGRASVVWAGVSSADGLLGVCRGRVADAVEEAGFARESRPFSPHLTVGRVRTKRPAPDLRRAVEALEAPVVTQAVREIVLMQSELGAGGPRYTRIGTWPLTGGTGAAANGD